ncbi:hypothetical protein TNCV_4856431 [Trichonephila clavipes]|nr:hypothetical protein TNCV_4856431 [Trichonephila clavipes]
MDSMRSRHVHNRVCLGYSKQMSFWPPPPPDILRTRNGSPGGVDQNTKLFINRLTDSMPQRKTNLLA